MPRGLGAPSREVGSLKGSAHRNRRWGALHGRKPEKAKMEVIYCVSSGKYVRALERFVLLAFSLVRVLVVSASSSAYQPREWADDSPPGAQRSLPLTAP
ncbi:hypothetical protein ElyMa_004842200 [Elysia marginata]|uniref:Uncharacterized protein n=1 Tax=Elysia marginata TaxID=1093978 RepID=A0AAV4IMH6_9GAST|nr:hypothetical protein ElyMa_004842200 [Elysia marginata]